MGTEPPSLRTGEQPLLVFVSSVMDDELDWARREMVRALDLMPGLSAWAFEYTPASSESADQSYLRKVREADVVVWLIGSRTTQPVVNEVVEAMASSRRLLGFKFPATQRDLATDELLSRVGHYAKWAPIARQEAFAHTVQLTMWDELIRAYRGRPGMGRVDRIDEFRRGSRARIIDRWQAAGLSLEEASDLADDPRVGALDDDLRPRRSDHPVVVLMAELGSGKSLASERVYQEAVSAALADAGAPLPVYLEGRRAAGRLKEAVEAEAQGLGEPRRQGAAIIVDGADEAGLGPAGGLLREARVLAATWPLTTVLITTRPVPALRDASEVRELPALQRQEALELAERVAGHRVSDFRWPPSLRDAIRRPLFALLVGVFLRRRSTDEAPRSLGELLANLVEAALGGSVLPESDALLRTLGRLQTERGGGLVPSAEVGPQPELPALLESRLVIKRGGLVGFPLPVLAQWFAAQALAGGEPDPHILASDPSQRERWRYPMVIAAGTSSHDDVSRFLVPIAERDPGLAAQVIEEGLAGWGLGTSAGTPPAIECARQIRGAVAALSAGLGPLATLIAPLRKNGEVRALAVRVDGVRLVTGWAVDDDASEEAFDLPGDVHPLVAPGSSWTGLRAARPGDQAAWAWRWALETLRDSLNAVLKNRRAELPPGALRREAAWATAVAASRRGPLDPSPIPLAPLREFLERNPTADTLLLTTGRSQDLRPLRAELADLDAGAVSLEAPYPGPDRPLSGGYVWEPYTAEQLLKRTEAVFAAALEGYEDLVGRWFPALASRLQTAVTLPARLVGLVQAPSGLSFDAGPTIAYLFDPLPVGGQSGTDFRLAGRDTIDQEQHRRVGERLRGLRPESASWIDSTLYHSILKVFGSHPAADLAYGWLWSDLLKLHWVSHR